MAARPNIPAIRQWLRARSREAADLAARGYRAARQEAGKEKYREYLSDAYGRMRQRYPRIESTAREALDSLGVKTAEPPAPRQPVAKKAPTRKKKSSPKKTGTGTKKTASKTTTVAAKKTGTKKKAGARKKKKTTR